jgi:hypothetical protein
MVKSDVDTDDQTFTCSMMLKNLRYISISNQVEARFYEKAEVKNLVSLSLLNHVVIYVVIIYDNKCKEKVFYNVFTSH